MPKPVEVTPAPSFATTPEEEKSPVAMTEIFELNGKKYMIENRARPNLAFGFMRRLRKEGETAAEAWMMEQVLGDEALAALEDYDEMTTEDQEALSKRIRDVTMGGLEAPKA